MVEQYSKLKNTTCDQEETELVKGKDSGSRASKYSRLKFESEDSHDNDRRNPKNHES